MLARTHDLFAFGTLLTAAVYFPPQSLGAATVIVAIIANIIGALLPDIDQASNRLWDLLPGGNLIGEVLKNLFGGHRAVTHSVIGVVVVYKLIAWLIPQLLNPNFVDSQLVVVALMIGYVSHLVLDGLTEEGLPLMFPLKINFGFPPIKSWRIKTGKWFENWVVFPAIIIYLIIWLSRWFRG